METLEINSMVPTNSPQHSAHGPAHLLSGGRQAESLEAWSLGLQFCGAVGATMLRGYKKLRFYSYQGNTKATRMMLRGLTQG